MLTYTNILSWQILIHLQPNSPMKQLKLLKICINLIVTCFTCDYRSYVHIPLTYNTFSLDYTSSSKQNTMVINLITIKSITNLLCLSWCFWKVRCVKHHTYCVRNWLYKKKQRSLSYNMWGEERDTKNVRPKFDLFIKMSNKFLLSKRSSKQLWHPN